MCERTRCAFTARFWVQRNSCNILVCGRHVTGAVVQLAAMTPEHSHELYHIKRGSTVTVKLRTEQAPGIFTYV